MPTDSSSFKSALAELASGVSIVTFLSEEGPTGLTVSSFTSLSLDPPLVVFSIKSESPNIASIQKAGGFSVNILSVVQESLSGIFATPGSDRSSAISHAGATQGLYGSWCFPDSKSILECKLDSLYPKGDHTLLFGLVEKITVPHPESSPLIYYKRNYHRI